jgi:hypothetical protein
MRVFWSHCRALFCVLFVLWHISFSLQKQFFKSDVHSPFIFISVRGLTSIVSPELPPNLEPQPLPLFGDRYSGIMEDISVSFLKLDWQKLVYLLYMYHLCKMDYVHLTWKIVFAMKMKYVTKQRVWNKNKMFEG